jgi:hypothetical protein
MMKVPKLVLMLVGILIIGCMLFYVGCGQTGNPQDPKNNGGSGGGSSSPTPSPTSSGAASGELILAQGRTNTFDIALSGGYLYWTEKSGTGGVYRINTGNITSSTTSPLPASNIEIVATGVANVWGVAPAGNTIYFTQNNGVGNSAIQVVTAGSGNTAATTYVGGLTNTLWIKYNANDGYLYWLEYTTAGGALKRVKALQTTAPTPEIVCDTFVNPFSFVIDTKNGVVYVGEFAGNTARIMQVPITTAPITTPKTAVKIYSGTDAQYVAGLMVDTTNNTLYWTNDTPNSGVFSITTQNPGQVPQQPDTVVETGIGAAFDLNGLLGNLVYYSNNMPRAQNGSIYSENVTDVTAVSVNALGAKTTASSPFRFGYDNGAFYWTEYPSFNPTDIINSGGSSACRVMMYKP